MEYFFHCGISTSYVFHHCLRPAAIYGCGFNGTKWTCEDHSSSGPGLLWKCHRAVKLKILHIVALTSFTLFTITLILTFNFKYLGRQQKYKTTTRLLMTENAAWPFLRFDPPSVKPQPAISTATPCKHWLLPCCLDSGMPPVHSMLLQTGYLWKSL